MPVPRPLALATAALGALGALLATLGAPPGIADARSVRTDGVAQAALAQADSNRAFLRTMVDHHQGMLAIIDAAMPRLTDTPKRDARPLRTRQAAEQARMRALLHGAYADSTPARVPAPDRAMADSVKAATFGGVAARAFYRQVVAHHRTGVQTVERMLPHLTGEVRTMAEQMAATHRAEIEDFRRKGGVQ